MMMFSVTKNVYKSHRGPLGFFGMARLMVVSLQVELQYFQKKFSFFKFSVNFLSLGAFPVLYFVVKIHVTYNISERRKINCFWQYFESRQAENESFML